MTAAHVIGAVSWVTCVASAVVPDEPPSFSLSAEIACDDSVKAAISRAETMESGKDLRQAIEAWIKLIREYPDSPVGRTRLEILLERLRSETKPIPANESEPLLPLLTEAAELDVVSAMMLPADTLRTREPETAFKWYSSAAAKGNHGALTQLGLMHSNGNGTERDLAKAVECFEQAAEKGYPPAKAALAECYLFGKGVGKDEAKAMKLLKEAADAGNLKAMNRLGVSYHRGLGVAVNHAEAFRLFSRAMHGGEGEAAANLGVLYVNGDGVPRNSEKALECFQNGANLGSALAMYLLGRCYETGQGVEADKLKAEAWYMKAADEGHPPAIDMLRKKGIEITPKRP